MLIDWQKATCDWDYESFSLTESDTERESLTDDIVLFESSVPVRLGNDKIIYWGVDLREERRFRVWPLYRTENTLGGTWTAAHDDRLPHGERIFDMQADEDSFPDDIEEAKEMLVARIMEVIHNG